MAESEEGDWRPHSLTGYSVKFQLDGQLLPRSDMFICSAVIQPSHNYKDVIYSYRQLYLLFSDIG